MYLTKTIGRWQIELHQRAVYLTRQPKADPNCPSCHGHGGHGYVTEGGDADWDACHCLDWLRTIRIPLAPRTKRQHAEEYPF